MAAAAGQNGLMLELAARHELFSRAARSPLAEWYWTVDRQLLGALVLLLACGLGLSLAASPPVAERVGLPPWHFTLRHTVFGIISLLVMLATSMLSHRRARQVALVILLVSLVLLLATLAFGDNVKGARRWLSFGGFSIQPSEFIKPAFAVIGAWLFSEAITHSAVPAKSIATILAALISVCLLLQPDIGQTALVLATWAVLMFLSGTSWWVVAGLGFAGLGLLAGAYFTFPHFARRIDAFLAPEAGGNSYQMDRALEAFREGGWFGRGPGESLARQRIPDAHADYVFAAAAGEFGVFFCLFLVGLLGFIVLRAMALAHRQPNLFASLAATILAVQFAMQSGIHLGVNTGLVPVKGMTLPFVSYGGTSMLAVALAMGLLLALCRTRPEEHARSTLGPHLIRTRSMQAPREASR